MHKYKRTKMGTGSILAEKESGQMADPLETLNAIFGEGGGSNSVRSY